MDATRISDNEMVVLKRIYFPPEVEIAMLFSTEPLASHPKNHCVPIYEWFRIPDEESDLIIVMPQLRPFDNPRIKSVGEAVEFFGQIFEVGLVLPLCHGLKMPFSGITVHAPMWCCPSVSLLV